MKKPVAQMEERGKGLFLALQFSTFLKCGNTLQYFMGLGEEEEDER